MFSIIEHLDSRYLELGLILYLEAAAAAASSSSSSSHHQTNIHNQFIGTMWLSKELIVREVSKISIPSCMVVSDYDMSSSSSWHMNVNVSEWTVSVSESRDIMTEEVDKKEEESTFLGTFVERVEKWSNIMSCLSSKNHSLPFRPQSLPHITTYTNTGGTFAELPRPRGASSGHTTTTTNTDHPVGTKID